MTTSSEHEEKLFRGLRYRHDLGQRLVLGLMLAAGLTAAPGIIYFQRTTCKPEEWPTIITSVIAYGLVISGVLGLLTGALITFRQPHNRIGWLCSITGGLGLAITLANRYALCGIYGDFPLPGVGFAAWLSFILGPVIIALIFWQIPLWFPYGEYLSPGWRMFAAVCWAILLTGLGLFSLLPGNLINNAIGMVYLTENPFGINLPGTGYIKDWLSKLLVAMLILVSALANISLAARLQRSYGDERKQIQWFTYFAVVVVSMFLCLEITAQWLWPDLVYSPVYAVGFYLAWIGFPVVIGVSVLKYRLYDIDIVIRRTLAYTLISLLLGLIFLVNITLLQLIFAGFSGQDSEAAIAVSTLITAAMFTPLRRAIQNSIDRRFYRSKYDAARTMEMFSDTVRNEVELESLLKNLEGVVRETLQPEMVSVWIASSRTRS